MSEDSPSILLVEDEPLIRLVVADLLQDAGFRVIEAAHVKEALTILDSGLPISVMLTDVDMPGADGFELSQTVRKRWPRIEILIMSGRRWPAHGDLPPGAAFLAKPCPNDSIILHVRSAAERAQLNVASCEPRAAHPYAGKVVPFPKSA